MIIVEEKLLNKIEASPSPCLVENAPNGLRGDCGELPAHLLLHGVEVAPGAGPEAAHNVLVHRGLHPHPDHSQDSAHY